MTLEANVLLVSGIVGLVVGPLICLISGDRAILVHISSAFLGAFVGAYLFATYDSSPMTVVPLQIVASTLGGAALALVVNRILRE